MVGYSWVNYNILTVGKLLVSITPAQLQDYARVVLNHDAMEEVRERVQKKLFDKFRVARPEEREVINAIMDNESLFFTELRTVLGEAEKANSDDNDEVVDDINN